jgi:hypothetical protein
MALACGRMATATRKPCLGAVVRHQQNTMKTHPTRVYAKTGVSRQAGLMKLMTEIAAPFVAAEPDLVS